MDKTSGYLGVLLSRKAWKLMVKNSPHYRIAMLAKANENVNLNLFFFEMKQVDKENEKIRGYYFDHKTGAFKTGVFPYPDLLYRRGGPTNDLRKSYRRFLRQCQDKGTIMLNPGSLGNWAVYDCFMKEETLKPYLVETILYKRPKDLFTMLKKHPTLYLKGVNGRKGEQVMKVNSRSSKRFTCKRFDHRNNKVYCKKNLKPRGLLSIINDFFGDKEFMVQEGINLLEFDGRRVDLRAEMQRNKKEDIVISGISARMSQRNSPITIHSDAYSLNEFFDLLEISETEKKLLEKRIVEFLYAVYECTERKFGTFAEIGIDFALTKDLQIKFIECNSQSAKVSLYKAFGKKKLHEAMENILSYGKYLYQKETEEQHSDFSNKEQPASVKS
ncbi:YheC/YheD family endospore coat-associated protein [Alteribacter natronophilus]|uniref:YheC/YheD family endospore coat-associated protein n=1 Tax=Alteribacter natronophilus TaxID=2583810 RepID=UPI00110EE78E|nr:YheC/YheD family protein [Alteribacter natronophilus]TMW71251.1 YheC/YheD family protein [Alteribacter natronophilus]